VNETLEESILRERLAQACEPSGVLHRHGAVPEDAVIGRGRALRTRRRVGFAGAALSVAAVAAVTVAAVLPNSVARPHESTSAPVDHQVTVERLDPKGHESTFDGDPSWLAGAGEVDGARWQLLLRWTSFEPSPSNGSQTPQLCTELIVGATDGDTNCAVPNDDDFVGPQPPVALTGSSQGGRLPYFLLGSVRADVAKVRVDLADGESLWLYPVTADGKRYIAFAAPLGLGVSLLVAYDAHGTEIAQQASDGVEDGLPAFDTPWSAPPTPAN
jgi:hypothetical protein